MANVDRGLDENVGYIDAQGNTELIKWYNCQKVLEKCIKKGEKSQFGYSFLVKFAHFSL